jgi:uncharacterized protein YyaL (SSP411 family)
MAAEALLELALLSGEDRYRRAAEEVIAALAGALASHPLFFGRLLSVLDTHLGNPLEIAIVGDLEAPAASALFRTLAGSFIPGKVVAAGPAGSTFPALLADRVSGDHGSAVAYVCRGFVCSRPVSTAADFRAELGLPEPAPEGFQAV